MRIDWEEFLDSLTPWLLMSSFLFLLMTFLFVPSNLGILPLHHIFNVEMHNPHPVRPIRSIQFTSVTLPGHKAPDISHNITTTQQKTLYNKYIVEWQNRIVVAADAFMEHHTIHSGTVVVSVRVLPNGSIDSYKVLSSSNVELRSDITQILLSAEPFPELPANLAKLGYINIVRTWTFR